MRLGSSVGCYDFFKKLGIIDHSNVRIYSSMTASRLETFGKHSIRLRTLLVSREFWFTTCGVRLSAISFEQASKKPWQ